MFKPVLPDAERLKKFIFNPNFEFQNMMINIQVMLLLQALANG
jgi:hypothetical protein